MLKHSCLAAIFAAYLAVGSTAAWAITWELVGASFDDLTPVSGTFDYDSATDTYSNWDISVEAGSFLPAYIYSPSLDGGFAGSAGASAVDFVAFPADPASGRYIRFSFLDPLTDAGGVITLGSSGESFECDNCSQSRNIVAGSVSTVVPEPGTLVLYGLGLALSSRRRPGRILAA